MSWWQEVLQMLAFLGWWRIILILIATLLAGILASTGVIYLVFRFILKDRLRYSEVFALLGLSLKKPAVQLGSPSFPVIHPLNQVSHVIPPPHHPIADSSSYPSIPVFKTPAVISQPAPSVKLEPNPRAADLIAELDHNLRIIHESNAGKLSPLQNKAWLAHLFSNNKFSIDLEHQLEQVYLDISAWNNMLWIAAELSHQTDFSNKRYQDTLFNIAARLKIIREIIP